MGYFRSPRIQKDLFLLISQDLLYMVKWFGLDYSNAEISLMRGNILKMLDYVGITRENFSFDKHQLSVIDAEGIAISKLYNFSFTSYDLEYFPHRQIPNSVFSYSS